MKLEISTLKINLLKFCEIILIKITDKERAFKIEKFLSEFAMTHGKMQVSQLNGIKSMRCYRVFPSKLLFLFVSIRWFFAEICAFKVKNCLFIQMHISQIIVSRRVKKHFEGETLYYYMLFILLTIVILNSCHGSSQIRTKIFQFRILSLCLPPFWKKYLAKL